MNIEKVNSNEKGKLFYINIARVIAVFLIFNSHLEEYYPISVLATGGALGNAIFFFVSGYCSINIRNSFCHWYGKKLIRIYIPIFVADIILFVMGERPTSFIDFIQKWIWPTRFWFLGAIILFYAIYYFIIKNYNLKKILLFFCVILLAYLIMYFCAINLNSFVVEGGGGSNNFFDIYFRWIYSLGTMILGACVRISFPNNKKPVSYSVIMGMCFMLLYVHKWIIYKIPSLMITQGIQNFLTVGFAMFLVLALRDNTAICNHIQNWIKKPIDNISSMTLDIYIIQQIILPYFAELMFPCNIIIALICTYMFAYLFHHITKYISIHVLQIGS